MRIEIKLSEIELNELFTNGVVKTDNILVTSYAKIKDKNFENKASILEKQVSAFIQNQIDSGIIKHMERVSKKDFYNEFIKLNNIDVRLLTQKRFTPMVKKSKRLLTTVFDVFDIRSNNKDYYHFKLKVY